MQNRYVNKKSCTGMEVLVVFTGSHESRIILMGVALLGYIVSGGTGPSSFLIEFRWAWLALVVYVRGEDDGGDRARPGEPALLAYAKYG